MAKRVFDVAVTLLVSPIAIVIVAVMAVGLAIDLPGNPFFLQRRVGRGGRPFTMVKLRTMRRARPGEQRRYEITDWSTFVFSPPGERDLRVTRLGEFARRTSIDEIPNLWNVLRGEMSLVGPRPELPEIVAQYPPEFHRRHEVLPGIAGLAQVKGRSDLAYADIMKYDIAYVDDHSVRGDLAILGRTAWIVLAGKGAR